MGIPSYFSHIIKNYPQIIKNAIVDLNFDILLMDCNSIIYDAFYSIEKNIDSKKWSQVQIENAIIVSVIENIHKYISTINPTKLVYIAFDGVAPFAKMDQQRRRRYKTAYMEEVDIKLGKITSKIWNTASITPGTEFMNKLSNMVQSEFSKIVSWKALIFIIKNILSNIMQNQKLRLWIFYVIKILKEKVNCLK